MSKFLVDIIDKYDWSHFVTITNKNDIGLSSFKKKYKQFFKYLNKTDIYYQKYLTTLITFEMNGNNQLHVHSFIKDVDKNKTKDLETLLKRYFGQSKVYIYDKTKNAKYYVANKYNKLIDFDLIKINSRRR